MAKISLNIRPLLRTALHLLLLTSFLLTVVADAGQPDDAAKLQISAGFLTTLSEQERAWLRDHPVISVAHDPGWPPVEFTNDRGEQSGMSGDYLNLVEQRLGVKFARMPNTGWQEAYSRLQRWEIDMTTSVAVTPEREKFWVFTKPYMTIPIVIATHPDVTYIADMRELGGKRVAVVEGYAVGEWIPRDFPEIRLVRVKTTQQGLDLLQRGEVFAFIDNLLVIGDYQAKMKVTNIKIAGQTPYVNAQCMAVRKDWAIFGGILQKALDSIPETDRSDIYKKWLPIRYEQGFDYSLFWRFFALFAVIVLAQLFLNRKLSRVIKSRKNAEAALHQAHERLRSFVDANIVGVVIASPTGGVLEANDYYLGVIGYTREEFEQGIIDWRAITPVEWLPVDDHAIAELREHGKCTPYEKEYVRRDGTRVTVFMSDAMLPGPEEQIAAFVLDITERKQAENGLQKERDRAELYFNLAGVMLAVLDHEGRVTRINPKGCEILGYEQNELVGADWFTTLLPEQRRDEVKGVFLRLMAGEIEPLEYYENVLLTRDGTERIIAFHNTVIRNERGTSTGIIFSGEDITLHKQQEEKLLSLASELEAEVLARTGDLNATQTALLNLLEDMTLTKGQLEAANDRLKEVDHLKSMFIASMSHELRTPLNSVIGFSSILLHEWVGPLNDEQKQNLGAILRSGKHLLSLINDVIDVSKVEAGMIEVSRTEFGLAELLTEVEETFVKEAAERKLTLTVQKISVPMHTDRRRLLQCLLNLVGNALKYTEQGSVEVVAHYDESQQTVKFIVIDSGIGIAVEDQAKLFQPFSRIKSDLTAKVLGTGLGLYLTRKIVLETLHGEISATSSAGSGSRFSMTIPVRIE